MSVSVARIAVALVLLAAVAVAGTAFTAGMLVPASSAGTLSVPIDANALAPADCSSLDLADVVTGTTGTSGNDLILGTAGADTIDGGGGTDCIVGGGGDDTIDGRGSSICIGGPGVDQFTGCATTVP